MIKRSASHVLSCLSVSLAIFAIQVQSSAQTPPAIVFKAVASSYVESGAYANTNFGASPNLLVGNAISPVAPSAEEWTYVKFNLTGYTGPIYSATLELYGHHTGNNTSDVDTVYGTGSNWTQTGITWNNKPAITSSLSSATITTVNQYYAFDVTKAVQISAGVPPVFSFATLPEMIPNGSVGPDIFQSIASQPVSSADPPILVINGNIP